MRFSRVQTIRCQRTGLPTAGTFYSPRCYPACSYGCYRLQVLAGAESHSDLRIHPATKCTVISRRMDASSLIVLMSRASLKCIVQTFPMSDRKLQISNAGGYEPRWRGDGDEIYYLSGDRKLMAVSVDSGPSFGVPKPLFQTRVLPGVNAQRMNYVPSRDGRRFLINTQTGDPPPNPITVVLNWSAAQKVKRAVSRRQS